MPYVDEPCTECAGNGWKYCPFCKGDGQFRCPQGCDSGLVRCPANCDYGWETSGSCQYCHGTKTPDMGPAPCDACNDQGHMRCPTCNPNTHMISGTASDKPGYLRCPGECKAGWVDCSCKQLKWGGGKVSCEDCKDGYVAVWHDDPPAA